MSFALDISNIADRYKDRFDLVLKKVVFDVGSKIIMRSPVDEGRFRANWQIGVNKNPSGVIDAVDKGKVNQTGAGDSSTKKIAEADLEKAKGGDTIYFVNNLPYAERIENDAWSPQAEAGVVGVSLAEYKNTLDKIGIEVREKF